MSVRTLFIRTDPQRGAATAANNKHYLPYQHCCLEELRIAYFWLGVVKSSFVSCPSLPWLSSCSSWAIGRVYTIPPHVISKWLASSTHHLAMTDPDVILYLYPNNGPGQVGAQEVLSQLENKLRYMPPRCRDALEPRDLHSHEERESTEQPEEQRGLESSACLVLRFSHGAKTRLGVVAGRAPNVDLPLPKEPGVSRFHLAFTFDDKHRPIVRDLGSSCGTKVTYDGEERESRSNFDSLLQGPSILGDKPPVLHITNDIQFKVVVPPRDITSEDYIDRVARFRQGTADPEDLLASLILRSAPNTEPPTGTQTAPRLYDPALFKKKLGEGAFGVVRYVWNATTGEEYALKEPREKFIKSGHIATNHWEMEAEIMRCISHVSATTSMPGILKIALYLQPAALGPYCRVSRCHIHALASVDLRVCSRRLS